MSLPAAQRRALNRIGKTLSHDDLHLGQLFAIFTRLARHEPMPVTECLTALPWRPRRMQRMWPALVTVAGLAVITGALILSQTLPGRQACQSTVTAFSAHVQPAGTGQQPACESRQAGQEGFPAR
jgi:hypothetical protein